MIWIFAHDLVNFSTTTGFEQLFLDKKEMYYYDAGYWSSSLGPYKGNAAWGALDKNYSTNLERDRNMTTKYRVRCIKDIP